MLPAIDTGRIRGIPVRSWLLVAIISICGVHLGLRVKMIPQYRSDLGGIEHNVIHGIQKLLLRLPLYEDPEQVPFDVIQYTPAYYSLSAALAKVLGVQGDDPRSVYLLSRSLALSFTILTCLLVFKISRGAGASTWTAWLAAGLSLCTYTEHFYSRPDALQSLASLAAIGVFMRWLRSPEHKLLVGCALLAVLGFYAKQSGILVIILPTLYLLFGRSWKALAVYIAAVVGALAIGIGILLLLFPADVLLKNMVQGLANGYSPQLWQQLFEPATYKYYIGWHALAVWIAVRGFRSNVPTLRFLALAVPLATLFGLITGLKYGSRLNYLHEGLMLTYIATAILLGQEQMVRRNSVIASAFAVYGLLFMAFRTNVALNWSGVDGPDSARHADYLADKAVHAALITELGLRSDDHVYLTDRGYLEHFLVGQSVLTQKDVIQYSKTRLYDYTTFHRALKDGTVRYVITTNASNSFTVLDSIYTGWRPVLNVEGRRILAHKDEQ